ncbi:MAG TPA: hypothetical protein VJJ73_00535 [Candidatus Paceibacterota bacterium]
MIYLIIVFSISLFGMASIIMKHAPRARIMGGELHSALRSTRPFFRDYYEIIIVPLLNFWKEIGYPHILKEVEKKISRTRIYILKIENNLLRFRDYVRGKREIHSQNGSLLKNGNGTAYWQGVHEAKNERGTDNPIE